MSLFGPRPEQAGTAQSVYDYAHLARALSRYSIAYAALGIFTDAEQARRDGWFYLDRARMIREVIGNG